MRNTQLERHGGSGTETVLKTASMQSGREPETYVLRLGVFRRFYKICTLGRTVFGGFRGLEENKWAFQKLF